MDQSMIGDFLQMTTVAPVTKQRPQPCVANAEKRGIAMNTAGKAISIPIQDFVHSSEHATF